MSQVFRKPKSELLIHKNGRPKLKSENSESHLAVALKSRNSTIYGSKTCTKLAPWQMAPKASTCTTPWPFHLFPRPSEPPPPPPETPLA